jgi:methylmalonyl-CoA mutase cobalamin-binding domain/chain
VTERRIRVLMSVLGLDQHEAGALAVTRMLRDAGMEVIYTGRFSLPATIAAVATQEDVDVIGISAHSWEFLYYARELAELTLAADPPIPIVVGGSVITDSDRRQLLDARLHTVHRGATEEEIIAIFRDLAELDARTAMTPPSASDRR